ncbi:SDR family oxidoreductase [Microcoleus sp. Pol14C6]|uniref:SDR family oxidoreductase n=1 Tax=unclassified Microcoleus TaxID=2642155 RepID=UPI002FD753AE
MKVFLTGATGYVGSLVGEQLQAAGHTVVGLARTEASADKLRQRGIQPLFGDLRDTETLAQAARAADGVIHTAFIHDFSDIEGAVKVEQTAIATFIDALAGSGKPFVATSGTGLLGDTGDRIIDDSETVIPKDALASRAAAEQAILQAAQQNIRSIALRLPIFVYGRGSSQFLPILIQDAQQVGVARFIEPGHYQYSVIHVDDVAKLYVLALEKGQAGAVYHAVSESGISIKAIAEAIARLLGCAVKGMSKEEAIQSWGLSLTTFFSIHNQVSCTRAETDLGWRPEIETTILEDIEFGSYRAPWQN